MPFFSQKYQSLWKKRFEEEVDEDSMYVVAVERVFQMENFEQVGLFIHISVIPRPLASFFCSLLISIKSVTTSNILGI